MRTTPGGILRKNQESRLQPKKEKQEELQDSRLAGHLGPIVVCLQLTPLGALSLSGRALAILLTDYSTVNG